MFELALGLDEVGGDFVGEECFAGGLELADFLSAELDAGVLLVVEFLAAFVHALVLEACGIVIQEALDLVLQLQVGGIADDL